MFTARWARTGAWTAAGLLGAGLASGVTWAAASGPSSPSASTSTSGTTQHGKPAQSRRNGQQRRQGRLLRRVEHGALTLRAQGKDLTIDIQMGVVDFVSPSSVTVTSRDGYKATYDVTSSSRVRAHGKKSSIGAVKAGDGVRVMASGGDIRRLFDPRPGHAPKYASKSTRG